MASNLLAKWVLIGVMSSVAAFGVVYYGTSPLGESLEKAKAATTDSKPIRFKKPVSKIEVSKPLNDKKVDQLENKSSSEIGEDMGLVLPSSVTTKLGEADTVEQKSVKLETSKHSFMDRYVKKQDKSEMKAEVMEDAMSDEDKEAMTQEDPPKRKVIDIRDRQIKNVDVVKPKTIHLSPKEVEKKFNERWKAKTKDKMSEDNITETVESPSYGSGDTPDTTFENIGGAMDQKLFATLLAQAKKVEDVEARDSALLSLVDYATDSDAFDMAISTLDLISKTELRDQARYTIAMDMVKAGETDAVFEFIDTIEDEKYADTTRTHAIEAMALLKSKGSKK